MNRLWLFLAVMLLVTVLVMFRSWVYCAYLGTDFRGYYASAQIALEHGFSKVYDPELKNAFQETLPLCCPDGSLNPPRLHVSLPYLPIFVLFFLPRTLFEFTTSYLIFSFLNLILLTTHLVHFSYAPGERSISFRLLEWTICLPVLSNLSLGKMNVFLVICLGEFFLAHNRGKQAHSGWWVAGMLINPHTLILLLPGLAVHQRWRVIYGFAAGLLTVLTSSFLLAGMNGVVASINLAFHFAGPLIQTGPTMMNWRAMALNLKSLMPDWGAWGIAAIGIIVVVMTTFREWRQPGRERGTRFLLLLLATLTATFTVSWHSHFYMMMLLILFCSSWIIGTRCPPAFWQPGSLGLWDYPFWFLPFNKTW